MPCHQLQPEAADTEVMRLDDLQQVDEVLLGVRRCPVQQLVMLAASQLDDLGNLVAAVVKDNNRWCGLDDASQPGKGIDG